MLFINALCVVCATINSSKNGCFLRLYEEMKHFSFFANFSVFFFLCCCYCSCCCCCCCLFYLFFCFLEWKQQNVISMANKIHARRIRWRKLCTRNKQTNKQKNAPDTQLLQSPNQNPARSLLSLPLSLSLSHTYSVHSVLFLSVLIYKTAHFVRFCIEITEF